MDRSKEAFVTGIWRAWLAALAFAFLTPAPASAQSVNITPQLIAESSTPAPGSTATLALSMTPSKGWHGYWLNGGDAGFGMSVDWNLPEGVTVEPFRYPVPEALMLFGMMNHVYEHPYALLADIRIDKSIAPGTDLTLSGIANWLACTDKICVPESAVVSVKLTAGDGTIADASRARFDAWRARLPQPLDRPGTWERKGQTLRFGIPLPEGTAIEAPHLFLETQNLID